MKDLMKAALVCAAAAALGGCGDDSDTPFSNESWRSSGGGLRLSNGSGCV